MEFQTPGMELNYTCVNKRKNSDPIFPSLPVPTFYVVVVVVTLDLTRKRNMDAAHVYTCES